MSLISRCSQLRWIAMAALLATGCSLDQDDANGSADGVVTVDLDAGGRAVFAESSPTPAGDRRTVVRGLDGTVYADVTETAADQAWIGTIAGIPIDDPSASSVEAWRAARDSGPGQVLVRAGRFASPLVQDEPDSLRNDALFTVATLAKILEKEAGTTDATEMDRKGEAAPSAKVAQWYWVTALNAYNDCSWASGHSGTVVASKGGRVWIDGVATTQKYWGTYQYRTVYRRTSVKLAGWIFMDYPSHGNFLSAYTSCETNG
jgi:hypothetical protein